MKNNRVNIKYKETASGNKYKPESLKCNSLENAKKILATRVRGNIASAVYQDSHGSKTNLLKVR